MGLNNSTRKHLDRVASRLGHLQAAVTEFYNSGQGGDWMQDAHLPGEPTPAIELASHFLVVWLDWTSLFTRWRYWYGSAPESFQALSAVDSTCRDIATRLACDSGFRGALVSLITGEFKDFKTVDWTFDAEHDDVLDSLLWANDMATAAALMNSASDAPSENAVRSLEVQLKSWTENLYTHCTESPDARFAQALSHYKKTRLLFSNPHDTLPASFLEGLLSRTNPSIMPTRDYNPNTDASTILDTWLGDLHNCIDPILTEADYSSLIDDILDTGLPAPLAGMPANLIPGSHSGACQPFLIAFSRGATGPFSFATVLAKVRSHLIRCARAPITFGRPSISVAFFCDHWDAEVFKSDFHDDFAAFHAQGVLFVFELAASPRAKFTNIHVKLS
jgi:hypothetical protein